MALIKCKECKKKFSDQAVSCPNCGAPTPPPELTFFQKLEQKNLQEAKELKESRLAEVERILQLPEEERIVEEAKFRKMIADEEATERKVLIFLLCLILAIGIYIGYKILAPTSSSSSSSNDKVSQSNSSYCYDMWFKYGSCAYRSANGLPCKAGTDVIIPSECQNFSGRSEASKAGMLSNK